MSGEGCRSLPMGLTPPPERASGDTLPPAASPPPVPRRKVALHEAVHGVIAIVLGWPIDFATINPSGARLGSTHYLIDDAKPTLAPSEFTTRHWKDLEEQAVVALSACIGTARADGTPPVMQPGYAGDYAQAAEMAALRGVHEYEMGRFLSWLSLRAELMVDAYWNSIQRVAEALTERATLTGSEIRELIHEEPDAVTVQRQRIAAAMDAIAERIPEPEEEAA